MARLPGHIPVNAQPTRMDSSSDQKRFSNIRNTEAVMLPRLSNTIIDHLPSSVRSPGYERRAVTTGIVHLGVGAFHRAHQAVYTDDVLAADGRWSIVAASLRSPDTADALG